MNMFFIIPLPYTENIANPASSFELFFMLIISTATLGLAGWFWWIKPIIKDIKMLKENKLYMLIEKLNCSKCEARKILEHYKWDSEKVIQTIKSYITDMKHPSCKIMGIFDCHTDYKVINDNEIICFKCKSLNLYKNKVCHKCGTSLDGTSLLAYLTEKSLSQSPVKKSQNGNDPALESDFF
jgi:ribosomal protein L40E